MQKLCFGVLAVLALAACREDGETACGANHYSSFIGQTIDSLTPPEDARVIGPDTAVTRDYRPGRLNIDHDASGVITRFWCG